MPKLKVSPYDALIMLHIHSSCSMKVQPSSNICTLLVIAIVLSTIPGIVSAKSWLHKVLCRSTVPGVTSQSGCGLWLWVKLRGSDLVTSMFVFNSFDEYVDKNEKKKIMGIGSRSVQQWLKSSRDHLTGWKRSCWEMKRVLERSKLKYYTWWFRVLSTFSFRLFHGLVSVCWGWVKNRPCVAAGQQFIRPVFVKSDLTEV